MSGIEAWLNLPWYIQLLNFFFALAILAGVGFILFIIIKTAKIKWTPSKGIVELTAADPEEEKPSIEKKVQQEKKENVEIEYPSLLHHRVFNILNSAKSMSIEEIDENTNKGRIGAVFLRDCKFPTWENKLYEFIKAVEENKASIYDLTNKFLEIEESYYKLAEITPVTLPDGRMIPGIPKVFLKKHKKNNLTWYSTQVKNLEAILNSRYYLDWKARASACLDLLCLVFENCSQSAAWTVSTLNGEVDKEIEKILKR